MFKNFWRRESDDDENKDRGNWSGRFDFFLSGLGYAVGLGNVWRFPYLCYSHGGGAFLIPYTLFLFLVGIPLLLVEFALGQFASEGTLTCWRYAPIFQGVGWAMFIVNGMINVYYNVIIAWGLWFFFASFKRELPWTKCNSQWASEFCSDLLHNVTRESCEKAFDLEARPNGVCYNVNTSNVHGIYDKELAANHSLKPVLPAEDYLNRVAFQTTKARGIEYIGAPLWDMTLCNLAIWFIIFLCMFKGVKSTGKAVYFTAIYPYVALIILMVRAFTFDDGYQEGIYFYLVPDIKKLMNPSVWKAAAVQIFFSLSVSIGGTTSLSSYNKFHNDIVRDTMAVAIGNCLTSILAGFVVFSYLGIFAKSIGSKVESVVSEGVGLIFKIYPQAMTKLPFPSFWSVIFFILVITLGLDSQFAAIETIVTGISDHIPKLRRYKIVILAISCFVFFIAGLPVTTPGGIYVLRLMDDYCGSYSVMLIAFLESVSIGYVYGARRFAKDIETMIGESTMSCIKWSWFKWPWIICWTFISPVFVGVILLVSLFGHAGSEMGDYVFPGWANGIGWVLVLSGVAPIIVTPIYQIIREKGSLIERVKKLLRPHPMWGPYLVEHRKLITYVEGFEVNPSGKGSLEPQPRAGLPDNIE